MLFLSTLYKIKNANGSVAHLGERLHGMEEVASSILVRSTKITRYQLTGKHRKEAILRETLQEQKGDNPSLVSIALIHVTIRKHLSHRDYSLAYWGKRFNVKVSSIRKIFSFPTHQLTLHLLLIDANSEKVLRKTFARHCQSL